jgi:hypothetical protein
MVIPPQPVNGLAREILFFLKKMDAKQFAGEKSPRRDSKLVIRRGS